MLAICYTPTDKPLLCLGSLKQRFSNYVSTYLLVVVVQKNVVEELKHYIKMKVVEILFKFKYLFK